VITFDINLLNTAVFNRLRTDAAGSAIRALLADGASGIVHTSAINAESFPNRRFIAIRPGAIPTSERIIQKPTYQFWIYDNPNEGFHRINAVLPLLYTAFDYLANPLTLASGAIGLVDVDNPSQELLDPVLTLNVRFVTLQLSLV
jgi:hypothetical protein